MKEEAAPEKYWNSLYDNGETSWDIGFPSPAIKEYVDQLTDKGISILIPGCGNAYEAEYLLAQGFTDVTVLDVAPSLTATLENKFSRELGKRIRIVTGDFFDHEGAYDLILEQTFLSALDPGFRPLYVEKMHSLLVPGGHLAGVLFNKVFEEQGPPFGGTMEEYKLMFSNRFSIKKMEVCYNSIDRRKGAEVFVNLIAK
jgi:methyl halide transferase